MIRIRLHPVVLLAAALIAGCTPAAAPPSPLAAERSDSLAQALAGRLKLPGLSVAVALADGSSWRWQVGSADLETGKRVERVTLFRVGSVSKLFTAAITARLVVQGRC